MKRWTIKVDDATRDRLQAMQRPREDMNSIIVRLLDLSDMLYKVQPLIEGERARLRSKLVEVNASKATD